jgi:hypothetical protein
MNAIILLASTGTVALMGAFARRNRTEGWVKTRKSIINILKQAKRDLLTIPQPEAPRSAVVYAGLPIDPIDFASQLGRLQSSLRRADHTPIGTAEDTNAALPGSSGRNQVLVSN